LSAPTRDPAGRTLALFDFDGTLTTADTMFHFVRSVVGWPRFLAGLALLAPALALHAAGFLSAHTAKVMLLRHFLGGRPARAVEQAAQRWTAEALPALLRPDGLARLAALRAEGAHIVLVSASLDLWLRPFAEAAELELICTQAEIDAQGLCTGRLVGSNCNGAEKARRVCARFDLAAHRRVEAYGDSSGDRELLALADAAYFKPFR
jgi:phosphatidylglycerophosphatase C